MAFIYAISDIHGHLDILKETIKRMDLETKENKLILCGDYIDRGDKSCETLYFIKELCEQKPKQVIALRGNHEEMFLEQFQEEYPIRDNFMELKEYVTEEELEDLRAPYVKKMSNEGKGLKYLVAFLRELTRYVELKHQDLIMWMKTLPYYHETETQIFVHAGIDEEAGEQWKYATESFYIVWKFPATTGKFYKDIIAGHVGTYRITGDEDYHDTYWDGESHYYIDGTVVVSKHIPILRYDTKMKKYTEV